MEALKTQGKRIQSSVQARMDALLALLCLLLPSALLPRRAQAATPHTTGLGGVRFAGALTSALGIVAGLAVVGLLTFDLGARPPEVAVTAQAPTNLPAPGLNSLLHVVPGAPLPAAARPVPAYPLNGPTGAAINSAALTQASPTASVARRRAAALAAVGSAPAVGPDPDAGDAEAALHSPGPRVPEAPAPDRAQSLAPAKTRFDVGADQTAALELSERIRLARKQGAHTEAVRLASQGGALPSAAARAAAASAVRTGDYAAALHLLDQATVTSTFGAAARDEAHLRAVALAALGQDDEARAARARLPSLARARAWAAGRLARAMGGR